MKPIQYSLAIFFCIFLITACKNDQNTETKQQEETNEKKSITIPRFNRDSAYYYINEQVDFGPRIPGTEAHAETRDYLTKMLEKFGATVQVQDFSSENYQGEKMQGYNIIGKINSDASDRILLMAHWDSRFIADHAIAEEDRDKTVMGANDGASGVGVLLELARLIQANPVDIGVDIVLFDLEDQGKDKGRNPESWALGSQHWSRNPHRLPTEYNYGILLDMVGAENAQFPYEGFSRKYAPRVLDKIWNLADAMGYGNYFIEKNVGAITDDHYYVNTIAGIPSIDIIDRRTNTQSGFFPYWHTTEDTMDKIDKSTLRAVGQVLTAAIYKESINVL